MKGVGVEIGVNLLMAPAFQLLLDNYGWRTANLLGAGEMVMDCCCLGCIGVHANKSSNAAYSFGCRSGGAGGSAGWDFGASWHASFLFLRNQKDGPKFSP